jgi:hypothetical protein
VAIAGQGCRFRREPRDDEGDDEVDEATGDADVFGGDAEAPGDHEGFGCAEDFVGEVAHNVDGGEPEAVPDVVEAVHDVATRCASCGSGLTVSMTEMAMAGMR